MKRKKHYIDEETLKYMNDIWGFHWSSDVDELTALYEMGEYEALAKCLYAYGAVEPNCKQAKKIILVAKSMTAQEYDKALSRLEKEYTTIVCGDCGYHHWIAEYCDPNDWLNRACAGCAQKGFCVTVKQYYEEIKIKSCKRQPKHRRIR